MAIATLVPVKHCHRCGSRLFQEHDHYGHYWDCPICGYQGETVKAEGRIPLSGIAKRQSNRGRR